MVLLQLVTGPRKFHTFHRRAGLGLPGSPQGLCFWDGSEVTDGEPSPMLLSRQAAELGSRRRAVPLPAGQRQPWF